jgi:hypothetical protein
MGGRSQVVPPDRDHRAAHGVKPGQGRETILWGQPSRSSCGGAHNRAPKQFCLDPMGRPSAGLDPARLPVVVADQAIDAAASFARNEAKSIGAKP